MAGKVNKDTMYAPPLDLSFKCINSMTGNTDHSGGVLTVIKPGTQQGAILRA